MKKLTYQQVQYLYRGIREEFVNNVQIHEKNPFYTAKTMEAYTQLLNGNDSMFYHLEDIDLVAESLVKTAAFWEKYFQDGEDAAQEMIDTLSKTFMKQLEDTLGDNL